MKMILSTLAVLVLAAGAYAQGCTGGNANLTGRTRTVEVVRAPARGGCAGGAYQPGPVRKFAAVVNDARPHWLAGLFAGRSKSVSYSAISYAPVVQSAGCVGGSAGFVSAQTPSLTAPVGLAAPMKLTSEQAAAARRALSDPGVYEAAVTKVTNDLAKKGRPVQRVLIQRKLRVALEHGQAAMATVEARFDGHVLQMLIDNLPKILDAVMQIIKFIDSLGMADQPTGSLPMPCGPNPPARAVPQFDLAC